MKTLTLILIVMLVTMLAIPSTALAIGLTVTATISGGTSLGTHKVIACNGYNYDEAGDPWTQAACYNTNNGNSLRFGGKNGVVNLATHLYNPAGTDIGGSDCFYGVNFFIVYLYPDAWGGKGYQLKQTSTVADVDIGKALVFTPVYSDQDKFLWPDGTYHTQGVLNSAEETANPQLTPSISKLATTADALILKAGRARIVRAEYGIPPKPGTGQTRPSGWVAIPITKTAGTYTGSITITLVELPTFP